MACSVSLSCYKIADCFSSRGGIKAVWVANYKENAFTLSTGGTVTGFDSSVVWYKQELDKNVGSMTSTPSFNDQNRLIMVQTDVVFQYAKMDKENRIQMNALSIGDLMVIVQDSNNNYYALGVEEAVKATSGTGQTGTNRTDGNYYEITLSDFNSKYPELLDDSAIALLPTDCE